eukprot:3584811-Rhodomonas_salina.1
MAASAAASLQREEVGPPYGATRGLWDVRICRYVYPMIFAVVRSGMMLPGSEVERVVPPACCPLRPA